MTDFQRKFEEIRSEIRHEKGVDVPLPIEPDDSDIDDFELAKSELVSSWDNFKSQFSTEIKLFKWFILGAAVMLTIINVAIISDWAGFVMSPEYQQYTVRISK